MSKVFYSEAPELRWSAPDRVWIVAESFTLRWRGDLWIIPVGFKTDLASIPQALRSLIPQVGRHIQAAIVHDFFYRNPSVRRGLTRAQVDRMFLDGMKTLGVRWGRRWAMYLGVRMAGGAFWREG